MTSYEVELAFWRAEQDYFRQDAGFSVERRVVFWQSLLDGAFTVKDPVILEIGCGTGANLAALRRIYPNAILIGIEPNADGRDLALGRCVADHVLEGSVNNLAEHLAVYAKLFADVYLKPDLVLTHGVLIHVPPAYRPSALRQIQSTSGHLVALVEYEPKSRHGSAIPTDHCWPGDFKGEFCDADEGLKYMLRRQTDGPADGTTAWLFQRRPA